MGVRENKASDGSCVITIEGRFDINVQSEFRKAYEKHNSGDRFVIDLKDSDYLDSSALGMLLQLREFVDNKKERVVLKNCNRRVRDILSVAKLCPLFTMD